MRVTKIGYGETRPSGGFASKRIYMEAEIIESEDVLKAMDDLKRVVIAGFYRGD